MADASKTEKATPRRRQKAREQGQVARSRELPSVLAMAAVVAVVAWQGQSGASQWSSYFRNTLNLAASDRFEPTGPALFWSAVEVFRWIIPALGAAFLLSLSGSLAQGGMVFAAEAFTPKFERMNPAGKLGQMFSLTGMSGVLKSIVPFAAILYVGVATITTHWPALMTSSYLNVRAFGALLGAMVVEVGWKTGVVMMVWAGVDYLLTWLKVEGDMKMSQQDIRDEYKETEGNPAIKSRIRTLQRNSRRSANLKAAETATVVVTNPTHYAVALRYEMDMEAPQVVAKGRNLIAEKIKAIARDRGIPIMENKPLAQALYKSVEVGQTIPAKLYRMVAEILVVVFRAQAEIREQEAKRRSKNASGEVIE